MGSNFGQDYDFWCATPHPVNGIKTQIFFEKRILCRPGKNCYYFCESSIPEINLIVSCRDMSQVSKNIS